MNQPANTLTIIALARHEADHLGPCFKSLQPLIALTGARTLIVLDHEADHATQDIAHRVAERVVTSRFVSFPAQRNRALELASTDWVFFIDADERCTHALANDIARAICLNECAAFRVPRRNFFFGHEVRYTGWWPDYQIRLLRRRLVYYDESRQVHEYPSINGQICTLLHPLIHFNYETWAHFIAKQRAYAPLEARALYEADTRARPRSFIGQPVRELKRRLVDYQGYKDGLLGIGLCFAMALYRVEVYRQLRKLQ